MKITKYEHSCMVVEEQGKRLVIDPGVFTSTLPDLTDVCGIIVTHIHPDHYSLENLTNIQRINPDAVIYTVEEVANELGALKHKVVYKDTTEDCNVFSLSFFEGEHAIIHESLPKWQNIAVLINDSFYYPGDSLIAPSDKSIRLAAVPSVAPWMKISETMDFITSLQPEVLFPVHDSILSEVGHSIYDGRLESVANDIGASFKFLAPGDAIEV